MPASSQSTRYVCGLKRRPEKKCHFLQRWSFFISASQVPRRTHAFMLSPCFHHAQLANRIERASMIAHLRSMKDVFAVKLTPAAKSATARSQELLPLHIAEPLALGYQVHQ